MSTQQIYILIAVAVLAIIVALKLFALKKKGIKPNVSLFAGLALAFLIAGIIFGENRSVSYGLVGAGLLFAIIDLAKKIMKK